MPGHKFAVLLFFAGYIGGCMIRYERCQQEWKAQDPHIYTGNEVIDDIANHLSRVDATEPSSIFVKTTPVLGKLSAFLKARPRANTLKSHIKEGKPGHFLGEADAGPIPTPFPDSPPTGFKNFWYRWGRETSPRDGLAGGTDVRSPGFETTTVIPVQTTVSAGRVDNLAPHNMKPFMNRGFIPRILRWFLPFPIFWNRE